MFHVTYLNYGGSSYPENSDSGPSYNLRPLILHKLRLSTESVIGPVIGINVYSFISVCYLIKSLR